MYRNRKKILLITGTSVVVLAGFGAASWAIIDASQKTPKDNATLSKLAGITAYTNPVPFLYDQMSINDWMLYTMPKIAIPHKVDENNYTVDFYSQQFKMSTTSVITENDLATNKTELLYTLKINNSTQVKSVYTSRYSDELLPDGIELVKSTPKKVSDTEFTITNSYYWLTEPEVLTFSSIGSNQYKLSSSSGYEVEYNSTTNSTNNNSTSTFTTSIKTNVVDSVDIWDRSFSKTDTNNYSISYNSSLLNDSSKPIKTSFNYINSSNNEQQEKKYPYYSITYSSGNNNSNITTQNDFLRVIGYEQKDNNTIQSSLSSGKNFPYLPILYKVE